MSGKGETTLRDLTDAGREALRDGWREARNAYYKGARAAGNALRKAKREMPQALRSLGDFVRESDRTMDLLSKKAPEAKRNYEKLMRELKEFKKKK